jgi:hypothetical protein
MRFATSIPQTVADGSFDRPVVDTQPLLSPLETLAYAAARTRQTRLDARR